MSPDSEVLDLIVDLCAQVEGQVVGLRRECRTSIYEICLGLSNHFTKEMDRLVYHVRRLIDQNGFLYDRVVELEKRDDTEKVPRRNRKLHDTEKGKDILHTGGSQDVDEVRPGITRRRVHSIYRQAG